MPLLEPVFDIDAPPESLTRIGVGSALLVGSAGDGRLLFAVALDVSGAFHVDLPLSPEAEIALVRLRLITSAGTVERTGDAHGAPKAEAIATNDTSGVLAWNARAFPAVRVSVARGPVVAYGTGTSTYEQIDVPTDVRRIVVEFSDGLHSTTRTLQIFGR